MRIRDSAKIDNGSILTQSERVKAEGSQKQKQREIKKNDGLKMEVNLNI